MGFYGLYYPWLPLVIGIIIAHYGNLYETARVMRWDRGFNCGSVGEKAGSSALVPC